MTQHILETPGMLKALADKLKSDIDAYCVNKYNDGPRSHLGASQIGHACSRHLWYQFRWITHKIHDGRQYRLFQRGHFEEPRFTGYLEGIGCKVHTLEKLLFYNSKEDKYFIEKYNYKCNEHEADVTYDFYHLKCAEEFGVKYDKGKAQLRISGCDGHFGGSLDAIVTLPDHYNLPDVLFLGEYKTSGTGRKFDEVRKEGVVIKKNQHWSQMCTYGYKLKLKYGVYMVVNKDNDDLYIEVVKLDRTQGELMEQKADDIIFRDNPPVKIAKSATFYSCVHCDSKGVCWQGEQSLKNCRSCRHSKPVKEAQWECDKYGIIPKEHIINGCCEWEGIV